MRGFFLDEFAWIRHFALFPHIGAYMEMKEEEESFRLVYNMPGGESYLINKLGHFKIVQELIPQPDSWYPLQVVSW